MAWKEQAVTVSVGAESLVLEGVWQAGSERAAVVAPPHPLYGGSLDNPVVSEVAYALHRQGYASLRFNWRGIGASQGRATGDQQAAVADFSAALDHVAQTLERPILAAGYSFGAATALRVALRDPRVRRLLLVAPPVRMIEELPLDDLACPVRVIAGSRDEFAPADKLAALFADLVDARVDLIPGVDHFFAAAGLAELHELTRAAAS